MNIGIRLHDTINGTLEERLAFVKKQGFTCAHIALTKLGLPGEAAALTPGYAAWLRRIFEKQELDIAVLGNYLNLAYPDEKELANIQNKYKAHLRFASLLGCGVVGTETGAPNAAYRYEKSACHSEEALKLFIKNLAPVVEYAEACGVILAIEPVYKHIVWNPQRARAVLDAIQSPNLQIIFDPVNLLHPDNLDQREQIIEEAIELLGEDISIIHLKDYKAAGEELTCMGPGLGDMVYDRILRFAREEKPHIQITLENTRPENAEGCKKFLWERAAL
ncbi:MAG: sugar phosphate isomerase/epimerase [Clostridiales bacterium]|nr:sugar phosphate isomerase/epimerase [Clostridiales bacterium]